MTPGTEKRRVDFTDVVMYIAIASKHLRLIVLLVLFSLILGLAYYIYTRPVYSSKGIVRYSAIGTPAADMEGIKQRGFSDDRFLQEFGAEHVVDRAEARFGNVGTLKSPKRDVIRQVRVDWTTDRNIEINVFTYNPSWASNFPALMVEEFLKLREENARREAAAEETKLRGLIDRYRVEYDKQSAARAQIESTFNSDELKIDVENLQRIPRELNAIQLRMRSVEIIREKLRNPQVTDSERLSLYYSLEVPLETGTLIPVDPGVRNLAPAGAQPSNGSVIVSPTLARTTTQNWEALERERFRIQNLLRESSNNLLPRHPKILQLQKQLDAVEYALKEEVAATAYRFEVMVASLRQRESTLREQMPRYEDQMKRWTEYNEKKGMFDRGGVRYDQIIVDLQKRLEEIQLAYRNDRVQLQYLGLSQLRDEIPVSPNRLKVVLLSLLLGIGLAIGVPFLLEYLDQTVTNVEKMEDAINTRGLGIVPDFEDTVTEAYPLIFGDGGANPDLIENFRVIRSNLIASAAASKFPQVVMLTSSAPKEGKTVVASNLAMSFAHMGEKTLIIDGNLRRGILHHIFGSRSSPGLSNVLMERLDPVEACVPTAMENLHVLPCGDHLSGDIELLGSARLVEVMSQLRKKYQRIIVDAPPVLGLSETSVMQPVVDGVVMVIWSSQTPQRAVRTAMDTLTANNANFYGFILNRLDLKATMNRFHYYYFSNHYYNRYQALTRVG